MTADARSGLEVINHDDCVRLLEQQLVGRIAVVQGSTPIIFPVNYMLDGENVVFRTGHGTKLDVGPRAPACFEIDHVDPVTQTGWSVIAVGRLEEVTRYDCDVWQRLHDSDLKVWAPGERDHWMRLIPTFVSGRRIGPNSERAN